MSKLLQLVISNLNFNKNSNLTFLEKTKKTTWKIQNIKYATLTTYSPQEFLL